MISARDIFMNPFLLNGDLWGTKFRINENGAGGAGVVVVTATDGLYYLHDDNTASGYTGLYHTLTTLLNAACNGSYSWSAYTPTESTSQTNAGLRLVSTIDFEIDFGHVDFTMDPRWFGFRLGKGSLTGSNVFAANGTLSFACTSDYTVMGRWYSACLGDNLASRRLAIPHRETRYSSADIASSSAVTWGRSTRRSFKYENVPSAHVKLFKGEIEAAAAFAELEQYDTNNAFDLVWESLTNTDTILAVYNATTPDLDITANEWEALKLSSPNSGDMTAMVPLRLDAGEIYDINFVAEVIAGNYETITEGSYFG